MEFEQYSATNLKSTDTKENLPDPTGVLRGFKAIGYSIEEALSDLIDNSIDAKAKNVVIEFGICGQPRIRGQGDQFGHFHIFACIAFIFYHILMWFVSFHC